MSLMDRLHRGPELDPDQVRMTLGEHLEELRSRLIRALLALAVGAVICFLVKEYVVAFLTWPVIAVQKARNMPVGLKFLNPAESFLTYLKVSIMVGFLLTSPYSLAQIWGFISAGLYPHERRWVRRFAPVSIALFFTGAGFLLFIAAPMLVHFLAAYGERLPNVEQYIPTRFLIPRVSEPIEKEPAPAADQVLWPTSLPVFTDDPRNPPDRAPWINAPDRKIRFRVQGSTYEVDFTNAEQRAEIIADFRLSEYITFILHLAIAFGIGFQVPVIVAFLAAVGIAEAAQMSRLRRHVWFVMAIVAAVVTPPDLTSMLALLLPMILLFEVGLYVARIIEHRRAAREQAG